MGGLFDPIVWRLLYNSVDLADGAHGGEPSNFAVPVCLRVVRLDLEMTVQQEATAPPDLWDHR